MRLRTANEVYKANEERDRIVRGLLDTTREREDAIPSTSPSRRYINLVNGVQRAVSLRQGQVEGWSLSNFVPVDLSPGSKHKFVRFLLELHPDEISHHAVAAHWSDGRHVAQPRDVNEVRYGMPGVFATEFVERDSLVLPGADAGITASTNFQIALHNLVLLEQSLEVVQTSPY